MSPPSVERATLVTTAATEPTRAAEMMGMMGVELMGGPVHKMVSAQA
jgi:hypothetical protein